MKSLRSGSTESTNDSQQTTVSHHNWGTLFHCKPHFFGSELQGKLTDNVMQIINWNTTQYRQTMERSHLRKCPSFRILSKKLIKTLTLCWRALLCSTVWDDGTTWAHKAVNLKSHLDKWKTKTSRANTAHSYTHSSQLLNSCMTMTPRPLELYSLYIEHAL